MKPLLHWLAKYGYSICKCQQCKKPKGERYLQSNTPARQQAKRDIMKERNSPDE